MLSKPISAYKGMAEVIRKLFTYVYDWKTNQHCMESTVEVYSNLNGNYDWQAIYKMIYKKTWTNCTHLDKNLFKLTIS